MLGNCTADDETTDGGDTTDDPDFVSESSNISSDEYESEEIPISGHIKERIQKTSKKSEKDPKIQLNEGDKEIKPGNLVFDFPASSESSGEIGKCLF